RAVDVELAAGDDAQFLVATDEALDKAVAQRERSVAVSPLAISTEGSAADYLPRLRPAISAPWRRTTTLRVPAPAPRSAECCRCRRSARAHISPAPFLLLLTAPEAGRA